MIKRSIIGIAFIAFSVLHPDSVAARQAPPSTRWLEIGKPHLAKRGVTYVLVHTITSTSPKDPFWAVVEVNAADGSRMCEWLKKLEAKQAYRFECPLEGAGAGQKYPSRLRVFSDERLSLSDREVFYEPVLHVTAEALTAAVEGGAAPTGSAVVPDGVVEGAEPAVPSTFKPTWYRRVDRGFAMRAYENSGDLTVNADDLVFVDGQKTVRIPYAQILSVRWEPPRTTSPTTGWSSGSRMMRTSPMPSGFATVADWASEGARASSIWQFAGRPENDRKEGLHGGITVSESPAAPNGSSSVVCPWRPASIERRLNASIYTTRPVLPELHGVIARRCIIAITRDRPPVLSVGGNEIEAGLTTARHSSSIGRAVQH